MPELETLIALALILLGFGFVIFVHELGHFAVAKAVGIKVTQFAIGFGQAVFAWRKGMGMRRGTTEREYAGRLVAWLNEQGASLRPDASLDELSQEQIAKASEALGLSETEYRYNWMPLGGYVKMLGQEDMDPTATSSDPRAFNNKPVWARAAVISAGVIMNIIFGLVFFTICFLKGVDFPPAIVGDVVPGSPAALAVAHGADTDADDIDAALIGLRAGDKIVSLNDRTIDDFVGLRVGVALASRDQPIRLAILRDGREKQFTMVPEVGPEGLLSVGIGVPISTQLGTARAFERSGRGLDERLTTHGVRPGMRLTQVGDESVERLDQVNRLMAGSGGQVTTLRFDDSVEVPIQPVPALRAAGDVVGEEKSWLPQWHGLVPLAAVDEVAPRSGAAEAGIRSGDIITSVAGRAFPTRADLIETVSAKGGQLITVEVLRGNEQLTLQVQVGRDGRLGIFHRDALESNRIAAVLPDSPFASLNLEPGSRILEVAGTPVADFIEMQRALVRAAEAAEGSTPLQVSVTAELNLADGMMAERTVEFVDPIEDRWATPQWLTMAGFETLRIPLRRDNPVSAAILGIEKTHDFMMQVYITIARLFQGTVKPSHMRGPLGIADEGTKIARQGWPYLLFFLGLISVNLAVINFLPIPIVDGGLMVFLLVEKIKGSPVHPRVLNAANIIGLVLIVSLFLVVTFHDTMRLFGGR